MPILKTANTVVNNTYEPQSTTVYKGDGTGFDLDLEANQIIWYEI